MSELTDLYQEMILDHHRSPRNYKAIPEGRQAKGHNPLCGDLVTVYVVVDGETIKDIGFQGQGCAISRAAASMMTAAVKGKSVRAAEAIFAKYQKMVTGQKDLPEDGVDLGKLEVFAGVSEFPVRVKCATLPWHTLRAAIEAKADTVSTE